MAGNVRYWRTIRLRKRKYCEIKDVSLSPGRISIPCSSEVIFKEISNIAGYTAQCVGGWPEWCGSSLSSPETLLTWPSQCEISGHDIGRCVGHHKKADYIALEKWFVRYWSNSGY